MTADKAIPLVFFTSVALVILRIFYIWFRDFCVVLWTGSESVDRLLRSSRAQEVAALWGLAGLLSLIWMLLKLLSS